MQFVVLQWNQPYCGHTVLTDINSNRGAAPADLVGNNGFVSCFQMFDKIHDGYSKAHGGGFKFTPGHACASCADIYYCILKQFAIFLKLAAMRQVKKWSMRPAQCEVKCASHFRKNFTAQQFYNAKHFLLCRKAHITQKKHSFIRQTKECFSCERVTKRSRVKVKVSKSSVTALFDKLEFGGHLFFIVNWA